MKNFRNLSSMFLILTIFLMNVGVCSSPVLALEKEGFSFEQNKSGSLIRMREEISEKEKFSANIDTNRRLKVAENKDKIESLESSKLVERVGKNYVEGEVLVKYKRNRINLETFSGRATADSFSRIKSMEKKEDLKKINVSVLKIKDEKTVEEKIAELKNDPNVEYIQPNFQYYPLSIDTNDTYKDLLWGLENMQAPEAWAISEGSDDIIVAVIDSGVAYNHPDLVDNMWDGSSCVGFDKDGNPLSGGCLHGYDYGDGDLDPLPTVSSHGTHIAGTIASAKNNGKGVIGVAPDVKIMAIKSSLTTDKIVKGIDFAKENGAKIINASWGGASSDQVLNDAISNFPGLFIAAAGNGKNYGDPNIGDDHGESGVSLYPCDHDSDNIICVAATDQNDELAEWSDYGTISVDVGAPGVGIYSTVAETVMFSENFETVIEGYNTGQLIPGGLTTNWWGVGHDGSSKAIYTDYLTYSSGLPYAWNANTYIEKPFDLSDTSISGASLSFTIWCDTPSSPTYDDYVYTTYYSNGSWYVSEIYDEDKIWIDEGTAWTDNGYLGYYKTYTENISDYLSADFRFSFSWITDSSIDNNLGCTVDNIKITKYTDGSDEQYAYGFMEGTSMATPHVAGLAGLIWGYKPELTYSEVKDVILSTGDDLTSLAGKTVTGKRINAFNALNSITPPVISNVQVATTTATSTMITWLTDRPATSSVVYSTTTPVSSIIVFDDTMATSHSIELTNLTASTTYYFYTESADAYGNVATSTEQSFTTPSLLDTTPPVITLIGTSTINIYVGDVYEDQGATSTDDVDGDITENIVVVNPVDTNATGTYVITYNVSDIAGNPAIEVTRTVIVTEVPAEIEVFGSITEDTTWALISSPYVITDDLLVFSDAILTINEGVTVRIKQNKKIQIAGSIDVKGSADSPVYFTSYDDGKWLGIEFINSTNNSIQNAVIENAGRAIDLKDVSDVDFIGNIFRNNSWVITDTYGYQNMYFANNTCLNNIDVFYGIRTTGDENNFENNIFINNDSVFHHGYYVGQTDIINNNFIDNDFVIRAPEDGHGYGTVEVSNNWWGTIDTGIINGYIEDGNDDLTLQILNYNPIKDSEISGIGSPIIFDTTPPVISLIGASTINIYAGDTYDDQGATSTDDVDGDLTENIVVVNLVDTSATGTYTITYNVTDSAGNPATEVTRTVIVSELPDIIPPDITGLTNDTTSTQSKIWNWDSTDATAQFRYVVDQTATSTPVGEYSDVKTATQSTGDGIYYLHIQAIDESNNESGVITVSAVLDNTIPVINLIGTSTINLYVGDVYEDDGATALDNIDGDITGNIVTVNPVNENVVGIYTLIYNVADSAGNPALEVTREVNVVDIIVPVITLLGDDEVTIEVGSSYDDAGAKASDNYDGNITGSIVVGGDAIDTSTTGTYIITYNVTDSSSNPAIEVIRTVIVNEILTDIEVSGIITKDTTWREVSSPYIVTGNTLVSEGITLTIEPGVSVKFETPLDEHPDEEEPEVVEPGSWIGYHIKIDGTLVAKGTEDKRIIFTSNKLTPSPGDWGGIYFSDKSTDWDEANNSGSIIEYSTIEYGGSEQNMPVLYNLYWATLIGINSSSPLIKNSILRSSTGDALRIIGNPRIVNNEIQSGRIMVWEGTPYFSGNEISGEGFYIVGGGSPVIIKNNIVNNQGNGIRIDDGSPVITYNNIINNSNTGIWAVGCGGGCSPIIEHNNIYSNERFSILLSTPADIDALNNWWGTITASSIDALIRDQKDDYTLGQVNYEPFLTEPESNTPDLTGIIEDITSPVITLLGEDTVNIYVGDIYEDAGATAIDTLDGNITGNIVVVNPVNTNAAGTYVVSYNVADSAGNPGIEVIRTVIVNEATAPTAYLTGPVAGDRPELVITFNEALHTDTLVISDITTLLDSVLNDATGSSTPISVASATSSVNWDNSDVNAPIATVLIPCTTFIEGQTVRLNFRANTVKDLVENVILNTTNVDALVLASTQIAAAPAVTVNTTQTEVVITSFVSTSITVPDTVTNATINVDSLIIDDGANTTAVLPETTLNVTTDISATPIEVAIPADTVITTPTGWNGIINVPKVESNSSVAVSPDSGNTATVSSVVEVGYGDTELTFNNAVRLLIPDAAGRYVGYSRGGTFTKITTICSADNQAAGDVLAAGSDCKIDVGSDLVIWTKHFTKFVTYTQTAIPPATPPSSGGGGGGGGYSPPAPPVTVTKGDINNDKKVDKYDFALMMSAWGKTGANNSDINNDKKVDKYDFALLMANWEVE